MALDIYWKKGEPLFDKIKGIIDNKEMKMTINEYFNVGKMMSDKSFMYLYEEYKDIITKEYSFIYLLLRDWNLSTYLYKSEEGIIYLVTESQNNILQYTTGEVFFKRFDKNSTSV